MISILRPSDQEIAAFRDRQLRATFSYAEIGATNGEIPSGYHVDRSETEVGRGSAGFTRARDALRAWKQFAGSHGRIRVVPPAPPLEVGSTVVLLGRHIGLWTLSACRVVFVRDECRRFGFAYGTLEHAVRGEELFELEHSDDDSIRFRLLAFSVPSAFIVRLGTPVARRFQKAAGRAYGLALAEHVQAAAPSDTPFTSISPDQ